MGWPTWVRGSCVTQCQRSGPSDRESDVLRAWLGVPDVPKFQISRTYMHIHTLNTHPKEI